MNYAQLVSRHAYLFKNEDAPLKIIKQTDQINQWQEKRRIQLEEGNLPVTWSEIGIVLEDPYFIVLRDLVQFPNGELNGYSRIINQADLSGGRGVVVLPQYKEKFVVLRQFRHSTRSWHFEIPRGFGEPDFADSDNARKEIIEEIGAEILTLNDLGVVHNNTGLEASEVSLFHATLKSIGRINGNEGILDYSLLSLSELESWISEEKITDSFTIAAFTRAKLRKII